MKLKKELLKGSTAMLVLSVLAQQDRYGYQIIQVLRVQSEDVFEMNEGTLYPILHALEGDGALESYWCEVEGRRRKYYSITEKGKKELQSQAAEWKTYAGAVGKVLNFAGAVG